MPGAVVPASPGAPEGAAEGSTAMQTVIRKEPDS